jgi:glutamate--cysteine ligase
MAVPALVKGLFYDPASSAAAWELLRPAGFEEHVKLRQEAARKGLRAEARGRTLAQICRELTALAREGLLRLVGEGLAERSETGYLSPLEELLRQEKVPGQLLMDCVEGAQDGPDKVRRILRCAAI